MAYKDVFMLDDESIYQVCKYTKKLGAIAMIHAENGSVIARVRIFIARVRIYLNLTLLIQTIEELNYYI